MDALANPSLAADQTTFNRTMEAARVQLNSAFALVCHDASLRLQYNKSILALSADFRQQALRGQLTWAQAATRASEARNLAMDMTRGGSTPPGRALAQWLKATGLTLNELIAKYTLQLHGPSANFNTLSTTQKNAVFSKIVDSAGRSSPRINTYLRLGSRWGRRFIYFSLAVSVYNIATADNPGQQAAREATVLGAGMAGMAVGAWAGLACGPLAPACVPIFGFVGGALAISFFD